MKVMVKVMVMVMVMAMTLTVLRSRAAFADDDRLLLAQELESNGRALRLEGILTTVAGAGMLAGTAILWLQGDDCMGPPSNCSGTKWLLLSFGLPTTAFGVTMWWLGQHEIGQAERMRAAPWFAPAKNGAMAGVGVTF